MAASENTWQHLEASGSTSQHLGWQHLAASGSSGSIWHHLGSSTGRSEPWGLETQKKHSFLLKCQTKKVSGAKSDEELDMFEEKVLRKYQKSGDYNWEVLTFAKLKSHFTKCSEGQVHQVLYLCMGKPGDLPELSRERTGFSLMSELEPYVRGGIFKEKCFVTYREESQRCAG